MIFVPLSSMDLPALLINLDRDVQKLTSVTERLQSAGITFERIPAVDGSALTQDDLHRRCTATCKHYCPKGAIGCFLSHVEAWRVVASRGLARALVLEDDVGFTTGGVELISEALEELPQGWHVMLCGCFTCQTEMAVERVAGIARGAPPGRDISEHVRVPSQTYGSQAYVVSLEGARKLLELLPKASWHVDWALGGARQRGLMLYSTKPNATYQVDMKQSSIASKAPILLNWIASKIPLDTHGERNLGWIMSVPLFALAGFNVTGWCLMFMCLAALCPFPTACLLLFDALWVLLVAMIGGNSGQMDKGYVALALATYTGAIIHGLLYT